MVFNNNIKSICAYLKKRFNYCLSNKLIRFYILRDNIIHIKYNDYFLDLFLDSSRKIQMIYLPINWALLSVAISISKRYRDQCNHTIPGSNTQWYCDKNFSS